jgi:hypothetical protein
MNGVICFAQKGMNLRLHLLQIAQTRADKVAITTAKRVGWHRTLTGQLDSIENERSLPSGDGDPFVGKGEYLARRQRTMPSREGSCTKDLERPSTVNGVTAGPGRVSSNHTIDVHSRPRPIDAPVLFLQARGQSNTFLRLWTGDDLA